MYNPKNSNPIVEGLVSVNMSFAALRAKHVFPTPVSPIIINLNLKDTLSFGS